MIDLLRERENSEQVHRFSRRSFVGQGFVTKNNENEPKVEKNSETKSVVSGSDERGLRGVKTTGFLRFYYSNIGRWISRDPAEEQGGLNIYAFINNEPFNSTDYFGLYTEKFDYGNPVVTTIPVENPINRELMDGYVIKGLWKITLKLDTKKNIQIESANASGVWGYNSKRPGAETHEIAHLNDQKKIWQEYINVAKRYEGLCVCEEKLKAYQKNLDLEWLAWVVVKLGIASTKLHTSGTVIGYENVVVQTGPKTFRNYYMEQMALYMRMDSNLPSYYRSAQKADDEAAKIPCP